MLERFLDYSVVSILGSVLDPLLAQMDTLKQQMYVAHPAVRRAYREM